MANRTIYVKPEAEQVYTRAQELAAEHGVSLSDVISGLLALMVAVHDRPAVPPDPIERARQVFASLDETGGCDHCDRPGGVRLTFDLTEPGAPLTIERLCPDHAAAISPLDVAR